MTIFFHERRIVNALFELRSREYVSSSDISSNDDLQNIHTL